MRENQSLKKQPTHVLGLVHTLNARPFRLTAAAGTELAGTNISCSSKIEMKVYRVSTRWPSIFLLLKIPLSSDLDQAFAHCQKFFTAAA
jgi:hypothetical protein